LEDTFEQRLLGKRYVSFAQARLTAKKPAAKKLQSSLLSVPKLNVAFKVFPILLFLLALWQLEFHQPLFANDANLRTFQITN
jgi:hypothetical protein